MVPTGARTPRALLSPTAQALSLRFDRERFWYEFLRAGFSAPGLKRVPYFKRKSVQSAKIPAL
jgi:hypothetical protein